MKTNEFNTKLMTTKIIFNEDHIRPGDMIEIYRIYRESPKESEGKLIIQGIIEHVDFSVIKYQYYDHSNNKIATGFLYPPDVLTEEYSDDQWESRESLHIFKIIPGVYP